MMSLISRLSVTDEHSYFQGPQQPLQFPLRGIYTDDQGGITSPKKQVPSKDGKQFADVSLLRQQTRVLNAGLAS